MVRINDSQARDLDETRRLLYLALFAGRGAKRYNLAGTIVNAIKHHQGTDLPGESGPVASQALLQKVQDYVEGSAPAGDTWVEDQILRILEALGENGASHA